MLMLGLTLLVVVLSLAATQSTATGTKEVAQAAATAKSSSPTSNVKGKAFDRIAIVWLENTDYDNALHDPSLAELAKQGIVLSNYHAVTHPSQPNYMASVGGDYFGHNNDDFVAVPSNIATIADLLEDKDISWSTYAENMPYTGFQGAAYKNQANGRNDYVRKHNPLIMFDSVATKPDRLQKVKNFTLFYDDLKNDRLPQWMFITPNMTNDGHDTSVTVAGAWAKQFLDPLLKDKNFMKQTLVLLTWDENHTYSSKNRVLGMLLGDAVPAGLIGTTDDGLYTHYSSLSTVEANWNLHTLGRYDVGANVFAFVANKTGDKVRNWVGPPSFDAVYLNASYPGPLNKSPRGDWTVPNTDAKVAGRTVLGSVVDTWAQKGDTTVYGLDVDVPDAYHPPTAIAKSAANSGTSVSAASASSSSTRAKAAAAKRFPQAAGPLSVLALISSVFHLT